MFVCVCVCMCNLDILGQCSDGTTTATCFGVRQHTEFQVFLPLPRSLQALLRLNLVWAPRLSSLAAQHAGPIRAARFECC